MARASSIGQPLPRVDGLKKVTGSATYAAELNPADLAHGVLLQATVGSGRVRRMDASEASAAPGVLGVLNRENCPPFQPCPEHLRTQGWPGEQRVPLQDDVVHWQGQLLGMVVADSLERARCAATRVHVEYEACAPVVSLDDPRAPSEDSELFVGREKLQSRRGDATGVFAAAYDVGRNVNPRLARSQLLGGITFGIGMALLEQTIPDPRTGRMVNPNLAEYLIPVCADKPAEFDLTLLDLPDLRMPRPGAGGIGEIGLVGAPAAIANAVYHATGRRVRDLPLTPDKLLE